jgi:outer membrane receptor protein involved in Fe transport
LPIEQIKAVPAFLGEVDLLKTVQLLPGVRNAGEGSAGIYVRGGGPDQNLIMLDDAVVYNTGHLFGFFSIFNSDAIKNVSLIKGGMPAQYGGRLSSVLDVSMKEGNDKKFQAEGGIGLIASRISLQGPIKKNKASYIISARRTYIDALGKTLRKKIKPVLRFGLLFL